MTGPCRARPSAAAGASRFMSGWSTGWTNHQHPLARAADRQCNDGVIGLTQDPVAPGASFDYMFTPSDAGTFWYHTHNRAWEQMARGLYGRLIVEGDDPEGRFDRDLYLALDDWRLDDKGQIETASFGNLHDWAHEGRLGNWLTVNGTSQPSYGLGRGERMRLRLLNAANARTFRLQLKGANAKVIALDGAPVEPFALPEEPYELASGQRVDLAVDVDAGDGGQLELWHVSRREEIKCASFTVKGGCSRGPAGAPGARPCGRVCHARPCNCRAPGSGHDRRRHGRPEGSRGRW